MAPEGTRRSRGGACLTYAYVIHYGEVKRPGGDDVASCHEAPDRGVHRLDGDPYPGHAWLSPRSNQPPPARVGRRQFGKEFKAMKARYPRQLAKLAVLATLVLTATTALTPPHTALAVTRTQVQMGDPDIGDLAPKKSAAFRIQVNTRQQMRSFTTWLWVARILYFRIT